MNGEFLPTIVHNPRKLKNPESSLPKDPTILKKRIYSFTTDLFFIALINKGLMFTYMSFLKTYFYQIPLRTQMILENKMDHVHSLSMLIVFWGYFMMSYYWGDGKTPGKIVFGLKVYSPSFKHTGEVHLSLRESFARTMGYFLCYLPWGALFGISLFTKDHKGIPDWLSKTMVVSDEQMAYIDQEYFSTDFQQDFPAPTFKPRILRQEEEQLSLFDEYNELESDGTVIELPGPHTMEDEEKKAA